jgi:hypothetical protein
VAKAKVKYSLKRIKIFDSVNEQEIENYKAISKQHPIDRIRETVKLIIKVYGYSYKSLKERKPENKITFK